MKWLRAFSKWLHRRSEVPREPEPGGDATDDDTPAADSTPSASSQTPGTPVDKPDTVAPAVEATRPVRPRKLSVDRPPIDIQVGVDFGTSTTKIAFQQLGREGIVPVVLNHGINSVPDFCLPSVATFDHSGTLVVGIEAAKALETAPQSDGIRGLKVLLAGKYDDQMRAPDLEEAFRRCCVTSDSDLSVEGVTAVFLAYTLRKARHTITGRPEYRGQAINLAFNVCVPIEQVESNRVLNAFERVVLWAEVLEAAWPAAANTEWLATNQAAYAEKDLPAERRRTFIIPESVAQAASYVSSLHRQPGLHALIDLGAGTTDVSIFNLLDESDEGHSYWYASGNLPAGAREVERIIADESPGYTSAEVVEVLSQLERRASDMALAAITAHLRRIREDSKRVWSAAFYHLGREGPWHDVKIFSCGGGAHLPGVEDVFAEPWWPHLAQQGVRFPVQALPEPDDYRSLGGSVPFGRLAVAYGLAIPKPLLGIYTLPGDCPEHTPPNLSMRRPKAQCDGGTLIPGAGWV